MAHTLSAAAVLLPLSFCSPHPDVSVPQGIPCSLGPITLSATDQVSDSRARQIVAIDTTGTKVCGWKKPGASK